MDIVFSFSSEQMEKIWKRLNDEYLEGAWIENHVEMRLIDIIVEDAIENQKKIEEGKNA